MDDMLICECGNAHFTIEFGKTHPDMYPRRNYTEAICTKCNNHYSV